MELPITKQAASRSNRNHDCGVFQVLSAPRLHLACATISVGSFTIYECAVLHRACQGVSSDASVGCLARGIGQRKRESSFALTSGYEIGENAVPAAN